MAQKKQPAKQSVIKRLRARLKKQTSVLKKQRMAFGSRWKRPRFRNPFRRRSSPRSFRRQRRYSSGGFSRRAPILGFKVPSIFIWIAIIGGFLFFKKDALQPFLDKLKNKS